MSHPEWRRNARLLQAQMLRLDFCHFSGAVRKFIRRSIHGMEHREEQVCQRHLFLSLKGVQVPVLEAKRISTRHLNRVVLGAVGCVRMG